MKKNHILFLLFALCPAPHALCQQYGWTDISANLPQYSNYNDVHFIGNEGWITGWNDGLLYTPDGGETFQIQTLPKNSGSSSSVFMKNNKLGYVVTYTGKILITEDGGTNWTSLHEPGGGFNSVHCPPGSDTCYACGSNGTVYSFTNTGITDISPSGVSTNLQSICFPENNSDGKVCGKTTIARYKNSTWNNLQFWDCTLNYNSIFFINNNEGWSGGINGTIIHTIDGTSWIIQSTNTAKTIYDIFFLNSQEGWAAGSEVILHTTDGGTTWTPELETFTHGKALIGVYFTSPNNGYVVGNGVMLKYGVISGEANTDATLSSIQINSEELAGFNAATLNYQLELPTGTTIAPTLTATPGNPAAIVAITQAPALPGTATILVTAEDGETQQTYTVEFTVAENTGWVDISANIPVTPDLSDVFFVSDDEGWITSSSIAEIYHTTDGGQTFKVQTTLYTCNAIHMLNENEGYAGGASGFIYRTTDGGEHWDFHGTMGTTLADISFPPAGDTGYCCGINGNIWSIDSTGVTKMTSNVNGNLYSISFPVNSQEGWVCGGSLILHFVNNAWIGDQVRPPGGYNAIFMVDSLNGWIAGDGGIIAHTSDGHNWFEQTNPDTQNRTFYKVFFLNINEGWAVGLSGKLIHTENGGENWSIEAESLTTKNLHGVHFTSPTNGYVVGNGKTLLKYTGVAVDENTDATLSSIQINNEELAGFNAQTVVYNVELPAGTTEIPNITVTAAINEATVEITQATALPGTATIVVTAKDGVTQQTYTIHFTVVTGIFDPEKNNEIKIFPNPVSEMLNFAKPESNGSYNLKIVNSIGQLVLLKKSFSGNEIDVSGLKTGVYFLMLQNRKEIYNERFVKN